MLVTFWHGVKLRWNVKMILPGVAIAHLPGKDRLLPRHLMESTAPSTSDNLPCLLHKPQLQQQLHRTPDRRMQRRADPSLRRSRMLTDEDSVVLRGVVRDLNE